MNLKDSLVYEFKVLVLNSSKTEINAYIEKTDIIDANLENNISTLTLETYNPLGISINEGELSFVKNNIFEKSIEIFLENTSSEIISPIQLKLKLLIFLLPDFMAHLFPFKGFLPKKEIVSEVVMVVVFVT